MRKELVLKLEGEAKRAAIRFSDPGREFNVMAETFEVHEIIPLSDQTAAVVLEKNTGKKVAFLFYYLKSNEGEWRYFAPTDSHLLGIPRFASIKEECEHHNFHFNDNELQRGWSPTRALLGNRRIRTLVSLLGLEQPTLQADMEKERAEMDGTEKGVDV
jgi:hypothetical protein